MKGSQLSQLKSALSQAGLIGNGPKKKRSVLQEKDRAKKALKLREIQQKYNPFDVKVNKLKHDVLGKKVKGTLGMPAKSKQSGVEQVRKLAFSCLYLLKRVLENEIPFARI